MNLRSLLPATDERPIARRPGPLPGFRIGAGFLTAALSMGTGWAQKPNLLVILTDDMFYRAIGYNNPEVKTPHLDALAGEGLIFNRTYVASPICAASRASYMTGMYPQQHGLIALDHMAFRPYHDSGARAGQTLGAQLTKAGYHTAFWGKSHLGDPKKYGFAEGQELGNVDSASFAAAHAFLGRSSAIGKPFFLWLAPHQPHVPLKPAQKWLDLYDESTFSMDSNFREKPLQESIYNQGTPGEHFYRDSDFRNNWLALPSGPPRNLDTIRLFKKAYFAAISHLDSQVGGLVLRLKELGLYEKTAIVFLSDNGYHLGTHGLGNKLTMHEESVRIPAFIRWSGLQAKGKRANGLVSSLDIYPTLLELAGARVPMHAMGKSLLPLMRNPDTTVREVVFSEAVGVGGKPRQGHRMARSDLWKYVLTDIDEQYLFDESADRWELRNLFPGNTPRVTDAVRNLQVAAKEWMKTIGDRAFPHPTGLEPARDFPASGSALKIRKTHEGYRLEFPPGRRAEVRLLGLSGRVERRFEGVGPFLVPANALPTGISLLQVRTGKDDLTLKLIH